MQRATRFSDDRSRSTATRSRRTPRRQLEKTLERRPNLVALEPGMAEQMPAPRGTVRTWREFTPRVRRRAQLHLMSALWLDQRPRALHPPQTAANDDVELQIALAALPRR